MPQRAFDQVRVRCPRLGGEVNFGYCRRTQGALPCAKALVCYERKFPVADYFSLVLSEAAFKRAFLEPGEDKVARLLGLVEAAKSGQAEPGRKQKKKRAAEPAS